MKTPSSSLLNELVLSGLDDWVHDAEVCGNIARGIVQDPNDRRIVAIGIVTAALNSELVQAGKIGPEGNFEPWEMSPAEAASKIASDWLALPDPDCAPGELFWLQNTERGDSIARAAGLVGS